MFRHLLKILNQIEMILLVNSLNLRARNRFQLDWQTSLASLTNLQFFSIIKPNKLSSSRLVSKSSILLVRARLVYQYKRTEFEP